MNQATQEQSEGTDKVQTWVYIVFGVLVGVLVLGIVGFVWNRMSMQKKLASLEMSVRSANIQARPGIQQTFPTFSATAAGPQRAHKP